MENDELVRRADRIKAKLAALDSWLRSDPNAFYYKTEPMPLDDPALRLTRSA